MRRLNMPKGATSPDCDGILRNKSRKRKHHGCAVATNASIFLLHADSFLLLNSMTKSAFSPSSGTFQGQWVKGMRHGYGVRSSAPFGLAAHTRRQSVRKSPTPGSDVTTLDRRPEEGRGGFVLRDTRALLASAPEPSGKRSPFKVRIHPVVFL